MSVLHPVSRRQFVAGTAAVTASALIPKTLFGAPASATQRVIIHAGSEIGPVRPEFHGHFIEHLGSCVYGGLWVGQNSHIPNINGYRKQSVEYLKALEFQSCAGREVLC
jgi:alpha-N-arabinofuranosidase